MHRANFPHSELTVQKRLWHQDLVEHVSQWILTSISHLSAWRPGLFMKIFYEIYKPVSTFSIFYSIHFLTAVTQFLNVSVLWMCSQNDVWGEMPFHSPLLKNGLCCAHSSSLVSLQSWLLPSVFWNLTVWDICRVFQSSFGYSGVCSLFGNQALSKWIVISDRWYNPGPGNDHMWKEIHFWLFTLSSLCNLLWRVEIQVDFFQKLNCPIHAFVIQATSWT